MVQPMYMLHPASFSRYNIKTGAWESIEPCGGNTGSILREYAYTEAELEEAVKNLRLSKREAKKVKKTLKGMATAASTKKPKTRKRKKSVQKKTPSWPIPKEFVKAAKEFRRLRKAKVRKTASPAKVKVKSQPPPPVEDKEEVPEEEIDVERFRRLSDAKV